MLISHNYHILYITYFELVILYYIVFDYIVLYLIVIYYYRYFFVVLYCMFYILSHYITLYYNRSLITHHIHVYNITYINFRVYYITIYIYIVPYNIFCTYIHTLRTKPHRNPRVSKITSVFRQNPRYFHPFWKYGLGTGRVQVRYGLVWVITG